MIELKNITLLDKEMKYCIALTVPKERQDYINSNALNLALHKHYLNLIKVILRMMHFIYTVKRYRFVACYSK